MPDPSLPEPPAPESHRVLSVDDGAAERGSVAQALDELRRALDELRVRDRAIAAAPSGIVITDPRQPDGPLVYVNAAFLRMTGYAEAEVLGRNCRLLQGPDTDPATVRALREAVAGERPCQVTLLNYRRDGTAFFNEVTVSPVWDAQGALTHFIGVQNDVTARHEADAERRRAEEGRARQEAVLAAAFRREALLNRIGLAVRRALPAAEVERTALAGLAEALGADRCLAIVLDTPHDLLRLGSEWHRPDLTPLAGDYRLSDFAADLAELFPAARTLTVPDTRAEPRSPWSAAMLAAMGVGALLNVPLTQRREVVGVLGVCMAGAPRQWTAEEVSLVEAVASQLSAATEAARLRQREHNISEQLQTALQPELPDMVPGLALSRYYAPALEGSEGVGGDFYDCYVLDPGRTCVALVVADLAGKGLAAAAQVAAVRHGLRTAVFLADTLTAAVTNLNRILIEQAALTGFATLFVGAYDSQSRELRYVNCGQEPALLRRAATGRVEELAATGPILGCLAGAAFPEGVVVLAPGDALAIFSDGLTECGPSRLAMLGIEGVSALFGQAVPGEESLEASELAGRLARHLIAGVDAAAAGGVMRDDVCLLVAVAE